MTQTSEVLTQPAGTTAHVQDAAAGRQRKCRRDVGKVAEMPVHVFVHALALILCRLVGEVIERFCAEVVAALFTKPAEILTGCAFVVDAFNFGETAARGGRTG